MKKKTTYVIDTNVFLTDYEALDKFGSNDIVIPIKVLEEIDKNKKRQDGVGLNARHFIRVLDELREKNTDKTNLKNGIKLGANKGMIRVRSSEADVELLKGHLDPTHPDNIILAAALAEMENNENVVLVSLDVNMRVKCDSLGVKSETYQENQVVKKAKDIFTGFSRHLVEDDIIDSVYNGEELLIEKDDQSKNYKLNQFLILTSKFSEKKTCLVMFDGFDKPVARLKEYVKNKDGKVFGLYAKNKEQQMALNLLMDPKIPVVTLLGSAGSGKTLLSVAAALKMTLGEDAAYSKVIVSRPIMPMGKDIGFLPGSASEKLAPWIAPIDDNLEFLFGLKDNKSDSKATSNLLEKYKESGIIQVEALTYIRGRSLSNAFIIIDEAQNLTSHEIKTILTRVGENTKIVLTGDVEQIDNIYINESTNGLTYAIEKLKDSELTGHVTLQKGERSKVATLCAQVL
jgi:PhoH-like ATPase